MAVLSNAGRSAFNPIASQFRNDVGLPQNTFFGDIRRSTIWPAQAILIVRRVINSSSVAAVQHQKAARNIQKSASSGRKAGPQTSQPAHTSSSSAKNPVSEN